MIVSMNSTLMEEDQAMISVYDHGFLYGIGLFETFRTYRGIPFLLDEHLVRLATSCKELGIDYEPKSQELRERVGQLLQANELADGYIRLSISAGVEPLGLPLGNYARPTEIIYVKSLPAPIQAAVSVNSEQAKNGKPLQLLQLRRNTPEGSIRMKSTHYMNNILGSRELKQYPWAAGAEGLFLNAANHVAEGIVSNIFFVHHGVLYTPTVDTGILPGVTRAFILDLADELDIAYEEGGYSWEWLCQADDIFLTNSIQEIVPVSCLFDVSGAEVWRRDSEAMNEPITRRLLESYQRVTQGDL